MDLTPDLLAGAALGARVRPTWAALALAAGGHLVLDSVPHFDIAWIGGHPGYRILDLCTGAVLVLVTFARIRNPWVFAGAFFAVLPDAPPLKPWEERFPHSTWGPPWGIAVEVAVAGLAFLWAITAARPAASRRGGAGQPRRRD